MIFHFIGHHRAKVKSKDKDKANLKVRLFQFGLFECGIDRVATNLENMENMENPETQAI